MRQYKNFFSLFKNKIHLVSAIFLFFITGQFINVSSALAEVNYSMPGIAVGLKLNTMDAQNSTSNKQSQSFQAGGSIVFDFGSGDSRDFGLKTGLFYSERAFKSEVNQSVLEGTLTYAEIPLQVMFKFEDYAGIFFGPTFSTKLGDNCKTGCTTTGLTNVRASIMPLTFGAQFKVAANFGLSLFFETVSSELANELKNSRAIGANILFVFD